MNNSGILTEPSETAVKSQYMAQAVQKADNFLVMAGIDPVGLHNAIGEDKLSELGLARFYDIRVDHYRVAGQAEVSEYNSLLAAAMPNPKEAPLDVKEAMHKAWYRLTECWK